MYNLYCWLYCIYKLHKKLNKNLQVPYLPLVSFWNLKSLSFICSHSLPFVFILCTTRFVALHRKWSFPLRVFSGNVDLLTFTEEILTCCFHSLLSSLSFVVTCCTTCLHSLLFDAPLFVICFHSLCYSLYHSLSLSGPLVCFFINDQFQYILFAAIKPN